MKLDKTNDGIAKRYDKLSSSHFRHRLPLLLPSSPFSKMHLETELRGGGVEYRVHVPFTSIAIILFTKSAVDWTAATTYFKASF